MCHQVFLADDRHEKRTVALKYAVIGRGETPGLGVGVDPTLCREVALLSALRHPNILTLHDVVTVLPEQGLLQVCLVLEYAERGDLSHFLGAPG